MVPKKLFFTKGVGKHKERLTSFELALRDAGIASQNLVRVLPELQGPRIDAYFVYPEELRNSKRIQVFRDFLLRKVAEGKMQG